MVIKRALTLFASAVFAFANVNLENQRQIDDAVTKASIIKKSVEAAMESDGNPPSTVTEIEARFGLGVDFTNMNGDPISFRVERQNAVDVDTGFKENETDEKLTNYFLSKPIEEWTYRYIGNGNLHIEYPLAVKAIANAQNSSIKPFAYNIGDSATDITKRFWLSSLFWDRYYEPMYYDTKLGKWVSLKENAYMYFDPLRGVVDNKPLTLIKTYWEKTPVKVEKFEVNLQCQNGATYNYKTKRCEAYTSKACPSGTVYIPSLDKCQKTTYVSKITKSQKVKEIVYGKIVYTDPVYRSTTVCAPNSTNRCYVWYGNRCIYWTCWPTVTKQTVTCPYGYSKTYSSSNGLRCYKVVGDTVPKVPKTTLEQKDPTYVYVRKYAYKQYVNTGRYTYTSKRAKRQLTCSGIVNGLVTKVYRPTYAYDNYQDVCVWSDPSWNGGLAGTSNPACWDPCRYMPNKPAGYINLVPAFPGCNCCGYRKFIGKVYTCGTGYAVGSRRSSTYDPNDTCISCSLKCPPGTRYVGGIVWYDLNNKKCGGSYRCCVNPRYTTTYVCPSGYQSYGSRCRKPIYEYRCPSGYSSISYNRCAKTVREPRCYWPYSYNATSKKCERTKTVYVCPTGTKEIDGKCFKPQTVTKVTQVTVCPTGTTDVGSKCKKTEYIAPSCSGKKMPVAPYYKTPYYGHNGVCYSDAGLYCKTHGVSWDGIYTCYDNKYYCPDSSSKSWTYKRYGGSRYMVSGSYAIDLTRGMCRKYRYDCDTDKYLYGLGEHPVFNNASGLMNAIANADEKLNGVAEDITKRPVIKPSESGAMCVRLRYDDFRQSRTAPTYTIDKTSVKGF